MANAWKLATLMGGCALASAVAFSAASMRPAKAAAGKGRALQVQKINVAQGSGVPANTIVEVTMSQPVDPSTVTPATVQIRGQNATGFGYTKQVFGSFQVVGNVIRFYPRLPTHLRDASGVFFPQGSPLDDAAANSGFKPITGYEVRLIGKPAYTTVESTKGRALKNTTFARFTVAAASPAEKLWSTQNYTDSPPPQFSFSNPPDAVPAAETQYTTHGGTQDVPNSIVLQLYCTRVPVAPGTARNEGNVGLTRIARRDDYSVRRPIQGSTFVEQNYDTTLLAFAPRVSLIDLATYSLRVSKGVKDLTEQNDFSSNRERDQLRQIYDFLAAARALSPGVPPAQFPDPPAELITDWPPLTDENGQPIPGAPAERGVLKVNILALGDAYPDEIDPRTMLIFTSRDEPVTKDSVTIEFIKAENIFDAVLSTGDVDTAANPSSACATFTIAGGSAKLGDPPFTSSQSISGDSQPGSAFNYRNVVIPLNVIINVTGTKPVTILAGTIQVDGSLRADGNVGNASNPNGTYNYTAAIATNNPTPIAGALGGPGGGTGGIGNNVFGIGVASGTGTPGSDSAGIVATPEAGGRGGLGGLTHTATIYCYGGGGGGGGAKTAGTAGAAGSYATASWNGQGGQGGAGATGVGNLSPLVGGAGGGGGGNGQANNYTWGFSGGSGGGGGGAMIVQTSAVLKIGTLGTIRARGGVGGRGSGTVSSFAAGPGGGGGGGSLLLRSTKGYSITNPLVQLDVTGGAGGAQPVSGQAGPAPNGGTGGTGFVRTEDPSGGILIPGGTQGIYDPVGAGVASFVYTKWVDLGVQDPRITAWDKESIGTYPQNDAIYVQAQMTTEHPTLYGTPDFSALLPSQDSSNVKIMSQWQPLKLHDLTGTVGGALQPTVGVIPGLPPNPPTEYASFPVAPFNGLGYRFIRFRIWFQLEATQTSTAILPFVDYIVTKFEFNF